MNTRIHRRDLLGVGTAMSLAAISPAARAATADPALVAAARREGKVMFYGEIITPTQRALKADFEQRYPGITVDILYLSGAPMMNRVMSEQSAGRYLADVLVLDALRMPALIEKGILARYVSTEAGHYDAKWQSDPQGYWIQNHLYLVGVMYNKQAIRPNAPPASYEDLLRPEWAGKIAMVTPTANELMLYFASGMIRDRGETAAFEFFRALAAQKPLIFGPGGIRVSQGVNTGEFPVALGFVAHVFTVGGGEDGPMAIAPVRPIYVASGPGIAVMQHAPRPSAARLFADYLNSREAQQIISGFGYFSTYNGVEHATSLRDARLSVPPYPSAAEGEALRKRMAEIFGG